jgi:hypothetical protein
VGGREVETIFALVLHRTWPDLQRMKLLAGVVVAGPTG